MIYVTSDLHGYPLSDFLRLLDRARFSDDDDLIVLGDVIDRNGDGGIGMLRWMVQQENVRMILGNHEALLLSCRFLFDFITDESLSRLSTEQIRLLSNWIMNGADPTLNALQALFHEDAETAFGILDYLEEAPHYDLVRVPGKQYVLVHSGLGHFSESKRLDEYTPDELLWTRPSLGETYFPHMTTVFGHTPTDHYGTDYAGRMLKTPTWINIDTGAAHGDGFAPMLLRLEDEHPFYIDK